MIATTMLQDSEVNLSSRGPQILPRPLPPSERDFEVFLLVMVENASTRAAAAQFGVSQTRIMQIRDRVAEWIGKNVPASVRLGVRERVLLSAHIAGERTNHLLALVVEAWHQSRGEEQVIRTNGRGETTQVRRTTQGDPRYLMIAMRINEHSLRLAGRAEAVLATAEDGLTSPVAVEAGAAAIPPAGDCSARAAAERISSPDCEEAAATSADEPETCDEISERRQAFLGPHDVAKHPVQQAETEAGEPGVLSLAAGQRRPLSRKERRARQRMLKKLRQAKARNAS
jgi:hypothetical protein